MESRKRNAETGTVTTIDKIKRKKIPPSIYKNFRQGDLVFGITSPERTAVVNKLEAQGFTHVYANELNGSVVTDVLNGTISSTLDAYQRAHYQFLLSFNDTIKDLRRPGGKLIPQSKDAPNISIAYRRACKMLITYSNENRRSHVLISNIDWEHTCNKEKSQGGVTDSELRAVYREYRKNGPNPHIFFYGKNLSQLTLAPWIYPHTAQPWIQYERSLCQKEQQKQAEEFLTTILTEYDQNFPKLIPS
jgi:hypothetical protein